MDANGIPIGVTVASASKSEVKLVHDVMDEISVGKTQTPGRPRKKPDRLIGDKGYDSNEVREALATKGIQPIIPARSNNKNATHQDGRHLRRYKSRWKVERTIAWLQNCRRIVNRWERDAKRWLAFIQLACAMLVLKRVLK